MKAPRMYCPICGDAIGSDVPIWNMPDTGESSVSFTAECRNCETTLTVTYSVRAYQFTTNHVAACLSMLANKHVKDIPGREHEDTKASGRAAKL